MTRIHSPAHRKSFAVITGNARRPRLHQPNNSNPKHSSGPPERNLKIVFHTAALQSELSCFINSKFLVKMLSFEDDEAYFGITIQEAGHSLVRVKYKSREQYLAVPPCKATGRSEVTPGENHEPEKKFSYQLLRGAH